MDDGGLTDALNASFSTSLVPPEDGFGVFSANTATRFPNNTTSIGTSMDSVSENPVRSQESPNIDVSDSVPSSPIGPRLPPEGHESPNNSCSSSTLETLWELELKKLGELFVTYPGLDPQHHTQPLSLNTAEKQLAELFIHPGTDSQVHQHLFSPNTVDEDMGGNTTDSEEENTQEENCLSFLLGPLAGEGSPLTSLANSPYQTNLDLPWEESPELYGGLTNPGIDPQVLDQPITVNDDMEEDATNPEEENNQEENT